MDIENTYSYMKNNFSNSCCVFFLCFPLPTYLALFLCKEKDDLTILMLQGNSFSHF